MAEKRSYPTTLKIGGVLVAIFIGVAILSLIWTPKDPTAIDTTARLLPPGEGGFLLGSDKLGRDILSVVMAGARNSLLVSILSTSIAVLFGTSFGLIVAGSSPRWQGVLTRVADVGVAFPGILVALVLATVIGPGTYTAIGAIIFWFIPIAARVAIGPARQILALDFVEASFAYGRSKPFVLFRHVLPNIGSLVIVQTSVMFAVAILIEAALSYLGVGAQPPTHSWGRLLNEAQALLDAAPMMTVVPGLAIVLSVLGFNLLGDGLRELLDPEQGKKRLM